MQFSATPPAIAIFRSPVARAEMAADMENRAIQGRLQRCRDITMDLRNRRRPARAAASGSATASRAFAVIFALVAGAIETKNWNSDGAVGTAFEHLPKNAFKLPPDRRMARVP